MRISSSGGEKKYPGWRPGTFPEPTATVMQKQPKSLDKEWPPTYLKEYISLIPVTIIISVNFGRIK